MILPVEEVAFVNFHENGLPIDVEPSELWVVIQQPGAQRIRQLFTTA
jgi:hypothetical protein